MVLLTCLSTTEGEIISGNFKKITALVSMEQ